MVSYRELAARFRRGADAYLEKNDRSLGIFLSHLDNIPISFAAAKIAAALNPNPLVVTAATRAVTYAWDLLVSPFVVEGFVYLVRRARGRKYRFASGYVRYQISHGLAHLAEEPVKGGLTYAGVAVGIDPGLAAATAESASAFVILPATNAAIDKGLGYLGKRLPPGKLDKLKKLLDHDGWKET